MERLVQGKAWALAVPKEAVVGVVKVREVVGLLAVRRLVSRVQQRQLLWQDLDWQVDWG